jgi:hypothetical protein
LWARGALPMDLASFSKLFAERHRISWHTCAVGPVGQSQQTLCHE